MKKFFCRIFCIVLITGILFEGIFIAVYFGLPRVYDLSYQKGFVYQYRALERADPNVPKIIVIGGSYMTFSVDSAYLSELTNMPAYTLGIHSGMGINYSLEVAEKFTNSGDIVVYDYRVGEENNYGMGLIFLSLEGEKDMFWEFVKQHPFEVAKGQGEAVAKKCFQFMDDAIRESEIFKLVKTKILKRGIETEKDTDMEFSVYDARAFEPDTGNLIYKRDSSVLTETEKTPRRFFDEESLTSESFAILNLFFETVKNKGANPCVTFMAIYGDVVADSDSQIAQCENRIKNGLSSTFISNAKDFFFDESYTYDGAIHMNTKGAKLYTERLAEDILNSKSK